MEASYELRLELVEFWSRMNPDSFLRKYCKNNNKKEFHYCTNITTNNIHFYRYRICDPKEKYSVSCYVYKINSYALQKWGLGETRKEMRNASANMLYALTIIDLYLQNIALTHKVESQSK